MIGVRTVLPALCLAIPWTGAAFAQFPLVGQLTSELSDPEQDFGSAVAVADETIVIGAWQTDGSTGAATSTTGRPGSSDSVCGT